MTMGYTVGKYPPALVLYFVCMGLLYPILANVTGNISNVKVKINTTSANGEVGKYANISCIAFPVNATIAWLFQGDPIIYGDRIMVNNSVGGLTEKDGDGAVIESINSTLKIANVTSDDAGNYTCVASIGSNKDEKVTILDLSFPGKLVNITKSPVELNITKHAHVTLQCVFEVYKPGEVRWWKEDSKDNDNLIAETVKINPKQIESTLNISISHFDANGTYCCAIEDTVKSKNISKFVEIKLYDLPTLELHPVIAINTTQLFLKWTVNAFNSDVLSYELTYRTETTEPNHYPEHIDRNSTSFVMNGLQKSTQYEMQLKVSTTYGPSRWYSFDKVTTLDKEPVFVPDISINGFSATSVTIGWTPPPEEIAELIHYYLLEAKKKEENVTRTAYHSRDSLNLPYMFDNLEPHSTYVFQVCACSDYTKQCGNWSKEMEAATLDGMPGKPSNVTFHCSSRHLNLTWNPPVKPNAEIKGYTMELTGFATYKDRLGTMQNATWGPLSKFMTNSSRSVRFVEVQPNTRYTVRLSAMTRTRRRGEEEVRHCTTAPVAPDAPPRPRWRKIVENDKYMFKMHMPKISERNGTICCYRVYMVRVVSDADWNSLLTPNKIPVQEYKDAHAQATVAAYITDIFSNEYYPPNSELIMGDGISHYDRVQDSMLESDECERCLRKPQRHHEPVPTTTTTTTTTTVSPTVDDGIYDTTDDPIIENKLTKRSYDNLDLLMTNNVMDDNRDTPNVFDGQLDPTAGYTLFVELIPKSGEESMYSEYLNVLVAAPSPTAPAPTNAVEIALQATCAVAALVLLAMLALCVRQSRRARKLPAHAHIELNPIQAAIRRIVGLGGRQQLVPTAPPDMPPIPKEELADAYLERHADSDYGFQKEFELLSECYPDRTTHASEARENQPKNRYPDIKAYDQTRVKLSQIDSIVGSDYINANYVMGYQERKQFICAQGPTDTTVNDFWRMIWEHGLELIVMLTNLEEYSKVKCSKYWPDDVRGARAFGSITVHHVSEIRYSDYIVRELKITKQPTNADGQPIVENNGIAKRNGECKDVTSGSAPASPRDAKGKGEGGGEARVVRQYHFLMWKDFAAPEYPHSILKFIKRVNEAWSNMVGRPVVVHCSAGVGRTGTLVALDCLLDQLRDTGSAAVFNTVAELRRQRNFLVQSQKQYVFVYRALVEYAHYGDTEIPASRLKSAIDRLRNTPEGADKCLMEHEFEKMVNTPVPEPLKSCAAGLGDELRTRNRSADCLPYDRNRVILAPVPGRDYSTYINASFMEAYDNSEGFIITQDPLPNTIADFWRMVSEHNVSTIVMLSELGDGKCPRYWDDGSAQYEHISVQYEESESCPYYTRRQFRLANTKSGAVCGVRQLQYQGWPTAPGHVPEVTRGLAELADAAAPAPAPAPGAMLVHCHLGTERSSLFVALCILICQLRTERRVDVCCVARKLRSQRPRTLDTFLHYEFLHRAILNYAELHNLLEDS